MTDNSINALLNPRRFPNMSPKMVAIVGCVLCEAFTEPQLVSLCKTSDDMVLGRQAGDCGFNDFIGAYSDLWRNWSRLLDVAGLTAEQTARANTMLAAAFERD